MTRNDWLAAYEGRSPKAILLRTVIALGGLAALLIPWSAIAFGLKTSADQCALGGLEVDGTCGSTELLAGLYYPLTLVALAPLLIWVIWGSRRSAVVSATALLMFGAYAVYSIWVA